MYYFMFLARHPDDQGKSNDFSIWQLEWYTYTNIKAQQEIVYNQFIFIRPNAYTDSKNYIQWDTKLQLTLIPENNKQESYYLVRPFNFESIDNITKHNQKIHIYQWRSLQKKRNTLGIIPPTFGINYSSKPKNSNKSKIVPNKRNKSERKAR